MEAQLILSHHHVTLLLCVTLCDSSTSAVWPNLIFKNGLQHLHIAHTNGVQVHLRQKKSVEKRIIIRALKDLANLPASILSSTKWEIPSLSQATPFPCGLGESNMGSKLKPLSQPSAHPIQTSYFGVALSPKGVLTPTSCGLGPRSFKTFKNYDFSSHLSVRPIHCPHENDILFK